MKWAKFRDRHGDTEGDTAWYLERRLCGLTLAELAWWVAIRNKGVAATIAKRYERRLERDRAEMARMIQVHELLNCELWPKLLILRRATLLV